MGRFGGGFCISCCATGVILFGHFGGFRAFRIIFSYSGGFVDVFGRVMDGRAGGGGFRVEIFAH